MPTDWVVYWMLGPLGLLIVGMAAALSIFIWSVVLGDASARVGFRPLLMGYVCGASGLIASHFLSSYYEFSSRVTNGLLQESQRWSIVPGWTLYLSLLSLIYTLPLATVLVVPLSALLLRTEKLTYAGIAIVVIGLWLSLATLLWIFWIFSTNEWFRTHRLDSFEMLLTDLLPGVALTTIPFLLGIHAATRHLRE